MNKFLYVGRLQLVQSVIQFYYIFQDLQAEIDQECEKFSSVTNPSNRILSSIDTNSKEFVTVKHKLQELTTRWNCLRAKSFEMK